MPTSDLITRLEREFTPNQARLLAEEIEAVSSDLVRARDFNELKEIVRDLGLAQKRTEVKVEELAEAQRETQEEIKKLTQAQIRTEDAIQSMRQEIGGMAISFGYMSENDAHRHLPKLLAEKHNIDISSKFIRQYIGEVEINFLAEGDRGKTPVLVVGEAKSRLAAHHFTELKNKIKEVEKHYPAAAGREIVPIIVVHSAREKELQRAKREDVIVVQTFEW